MLVLAAFSITGLTRQLQAPTSFVFGTGLDRRKSTANFYYYYFV
jgi:hypothetical protein